MEHESLSSLLTGTKAASVITERQLVWLRHDDSIGTALATLSSNAVLAAPVFVGEHTSPSVSTLIGFVGCWNVLTALLQSLPQQQADGAAVTAEQLQAQGAELCSRPVVSLFEGNAAVQDVLGGSSGQSARSAAADWELHDNPDSSMLQVIRSCFLPRPNSTLTSWGSGAVPGFSHSAAATPGPAAAAAAPSPRSAAPTGHSRHPAASHRVLVRLPPRDGSDAPQLAVLSQSDILRFLAGRAECLRPLGRASLADLGLASGSLHLAAGPPGCASPLPPAGVAGRAGALCGSSGGGPLPHIPSSPKPPLAGGTANHSGGGGLLASLAAAANDGAAQLQRAGSGSGSGPTAMQMSPPASPRVSSSPRPTGFALPGGLCSGGGGGSGGHRAAPRRQLVAVHESVTALEAFRVLLQQRVSAVAVLSGSGPVITMRLVGNLSASDLRHLSLAGFGGLALSVKQFLASKPLAPDQAIPLDLSAGRASPAGSSPGSSHPVVLMAHAPGVFTCQATASLEECVKTLGCRARGIHRVYVVDPDQRPAGVVTGTDVLQLLSSACSRD